MRPDDAIDRVETEADAVVPLPVDLRPLDAELAQSGLRARQMLHGRTQPTRYFVIDLRARLLGDYAGRETPGGVGTDDVADPGPVLRGRLDVGRQPVAPGAPTVIARTAAPAGPMVVFDVRVALFVAAVASAALILGAIGTGVIPH